MCDITIEMKGGVLWGILINGIRLTLVRNAIIDFKFPKKPLLTVRRYKPDEDGRPYTIGGGYAAELTEYYPVDGFLITVI